jgi:phosphate ABC transporter phosphate-binding protein
MMKAPGMRARLMAVAAAALLGLCASILAPMQSAAAASYVPISGAGSTWSYNAIHEWITDVAQFGMTVNYQDVGSSTGRSEFAQGTVDWGASEIPYGVQDGTNYDPPPTRGYAYMPDTAGGTTFMYNLMIGNQRVTNLRLSGKTIADIFTNKITMWNDPEIQADNPGLTLPAIRIIPVVRSDGSGATAEFTQWMLATEPADWNAYCQVVGRSPCTQTSTYPVQPGTAMIGQAGDLGVSGYVSQQQADGAIGYVEYSYALETGFPVALVLNAAGYYTEPTPENVAVSLLAAQINGCTASGCTPNGSADYLTQNLSNVYTDTDPRTYELSSYSYMILPTDTSDGFTTDKGYTLGAFGNYLLCQGQQQVDQLGYSALPINLVEAGYSQLQKIPGNQVSTATSSFIQGCNNPTFSTNGTNTLADDDPQPPACDKQGSTQCTTATGGAPGSGGANGSTSDASSTPSASASSSSSSSTSPSSSSSSSSSTSSGSTSSGSTSSDSSSSGSSATSPSSSGTTGSASSQAAGANGSSTSTGASGTGTGTTGTGAGSTGTGSTGTGVSSASSCDPNTGICTGGSNPVAGANGASTGGTTPETGGEVVNGVPVAAPVSLGDGAQVALMALAAALLVGVGLVPPLVAHGSTRRRYRRGPGPDYDRRDYP